MRLDEEALVGLLSSRMRLLRRNLQAVLLVAGVCLAGLAIAAALVGMWAVAMSALAILLLIALALIAHMHLRVGETLRAVRRMKTEEERGRVNLIHQMERSREAAQSDLVASVTTSIERDVVIAQGQVTAGFEALEAFLRDLDGAFRDASERAEEQGHRISEVERQGNASLAASRETLELVRRLRHEPVTEIDALLQVHRRFPLDGPVPLMWGWALSPRALLQVLDIAVDPKVRTVVECGSGTSTIYLGTALRDCPGARLVALEHLDEVAESVEEQIRLHGLEEIVEVRRAALVDVMIDDHTHRWYDPEMINDLTEIDLLLVDGPPAATGAMARLPAFPLFRERLSEGAMVALDDATRADERRILDRWCGEEQHLHRLWSGTPNLALLRWQSVEFRA